MASPEVHMNWVGKMLWSWTLRMVQQAILRPACCDQEKQIHCSAKAFFAVDS
jgi:hypothetical protein